MQTHDLKVWPEFFEAIETGAKAFEIRKNDRGFQVGDTLHLREWSRKHEYSGRELKKRVSYIIRGIGLERDYVCMSLVDE